MAALEGEGDRTLDHWRRGHAGFFEAEARSLGLEFGGDDEPILFERFAVIRVIGRADQKSLPPRLRNSSDFSAIPEAA
jgi:hypothetical protein